MRYDMPDGEQHGRRRERSEGEYEEEYERDKMEVRKEEEVGQDMQPPSKKMKLSTDSSSLSPPSTTSLSPLT
jgi:hypothetical protein